jgi:hypothetical protein
MSRLQKNFWVQFLVEMCSVVRKLSETKERRREKNCFGTEITVGKATNRKSVPGSSHGEYVGFRDNFFCGIQRRVSNVQACDELSGDDD